MNRSARGERSTLPLTRWLAAREGLVRPSLVALLLLIPATLSPLRAQVPTSAWTPKLTTGSSPVALIQIDGGLAVVNAGPTSETEAFLKSQIELAERTATPAAADVLRHVAGRLGGSGTVLSLAATPDNRFYPLREWLMYELSEVKIPPAPPDRKEFAGVPVAAVSIMKGTTEVLLVATTEALFELKLSTGVLKRHLTLPRDDFLRAEGEVFGAGIRWMAAGDVTGDGQQELVVVGGKLVCVYRVEGDRFIRWIVWHGGRRGEPGPEVKLGFDPSCAVIADINGDGAGDLLVANDGAARVRGQGGLMQDFEDGSIHVILSERTGFSEPEEVEVTDRPRSLAAGDFTGDGRMDIAVAGTKELVLLRGNGDGTFVRQTPLLDDSFPNSTFGRPGVPGARLVAADLNRDGIDELCVATPEDGRVTIFWGPWREGVGFASVTKEEGLGRPVDLVAFDGDGDRDLDLVVLDQKNNEVAVFLHRPARQFVRLPNPRLDHGASFVAFGKGGLATESAMAVASPLLTIESKILDPRYLSSRVFPRPPPLPPDEETAVRNLGYIYNAHTAPEVRTIVAQGGAIGGVPVAAGETTDYSFAVVTDRRSPGRLAQVAVGGRFPVAGSFADITPQRLLDLAVVFRSQSMRIEPAPWPVAVTRPSAPALPGALARMVPTAFTFANLNPDPNRDGVVDDVVVDLVVVDATTGRLYIALGSIAPAGVTPAGVRFSIHTTYAAPCVRCAALTAADLDQDGSLDLALVDTDSDCVKILWGKGDGTFDWPPAVVQVGTMPVAIVPISPVPGDPRVVLAVANFASDSVSIVSARAGRTLEAITVTEVKVGKGPISVAAARSLDWLAGESADGNSDLVVACYASDEVLILRGDGGGAFRPHPIAGRAQVSNILATNLEVRDGHGPTAIVVGDFDFDGADDVAFSVAFPTTRLRLAKPALYDEAVTGVLGGIWQDVFIHYSRGTGISRPPPPLHPPSTLVDIAVGVVPDTSVLAVLQPGDKGMTLARLLSMDRGGLDWQQLREVPVGSLSSRLAAVDLNGDGHVELITLETAANRMTVLWGPAYAQTAASQLPTSIAASALAAGASVAGAWLAGGALVSVSASPGLGSWQSLALDLAGGHPRAALAVPSRGGRTPPDLVVLSYRPDVGADEIRMFSGPNLFNGITSAQHVWRMPRRVKAFAVGHFDGDALPDVVVAYLEQDEGEVWLGSGDRHVLKGIGTDLVALGAGDLTGDGLSDLVAVSTTALSGRVKLFAGVGDGTFIPAQPELRLAGPLTGAIVVLADVDRNGRLDVIVCDRSAALLTVLRQSDRAETEQVLGGLRLLGRSFRFVYAGTRRRAGSFANHITRPSTSEVLACSGRGQADASPRAV